MPQAEIEQAFAKLKALLRQAAARTREKLWSTIGCLLIPSSLDLDLLDVRVVAERAEAFGVSRFQAWQQALTMAS